MKACDKMEYPPKVTAMYEAVIELVNEGVDMNGLKVADITGKAGIGKGTAYEYFSSKEEIIEGALQYEAGQLFQALYEQQEKETAFEDKVRAILEWIGTDFKKSRTFTRLVAMGPVKFCMDHHSADGNLKAMQERYIEFVRFFDHLLETGIEQGVVANHGIFEGRMALLSQIIYLVLYLADERLHPGIEAEQAVGLAYRNIMKLLRD